jgi:regulator of sirC expression with transglutaminase-like and TPR domain
VDFPEYAALPDPELDLLTGALLIATDAYPALDWDEQFQALSALSEPLQRLPVSRLPLELQARALADHLALRCGFRGNKEDYYDPRNSFLNDVLALRRGVPISLGVLYIEVSRRAGVRASGVGFPGHFLVRLDLPGGGAAPVIIDPFNGGEVLDEAALSALLKKANYRQPFTREMLSPTPVRHVIARMLMNLRGIYATRADYPRLLLVIDRFLDLMPDSTEELRDRGYLLARLGAAEAAVSDLEAYVDRLPHAGDVAEVRQAIQKLRGHGLDN